MFGGEILLMRMRGDLCNIPDPLDLPDDSVNPPNLEKYNVAHQIGFDYIQQEEKHWGFRLWRRIAPSWIKYNMNPDHKREWSIIRKVRDWVDQRDHYDRHVKELEIALAEGHSRIILQPKHISEYASYFLRINEYSHYYALNYGVICMYFTLRHPKRWWIYLPLLYISMSNAYVHSRYCRTDRFNPYRMVELDEVYDEVEFEPESDDVDEIESPEEYPRAYWLLVRQGRVRRTILFVRHQCAAIFAAFGVALQMGRIEVEYLQPTYRVMDLKNSVINTCHGYILPAFLDMRQWVHAIPRDIPKFYLRSWLALTLDQVFFFGLFTFYVWDTVRLLQTRPPYKAKVPDHLKYARPQDLLDAADEAEKEKFPRGKGGKGGKKLC